MSNWMNDALEPGDTIDVMRPAGLFVLRATDAPIVAFAGGSGITPVISLVKSALATTERPIALVYANRDADAVIFAGELERLRAESCGRLTVHHHHDSEGGFLDAAGCAALVDGSAHADFTLRARLYMDIVDAGSLTLGVRAEQRSHRAFRRAHRRFRVEWRASPNHPWSASTAGSSPTRPDTILEAPVFL
jgi:ferredoxin-NADP reductase